MFDSSSLTYETYTHILTLCLIT